MSTWIPGIVFSLLVGGTNIHFGEVRRKDDALLKAHQQAEHMAAVAERERIARDLHDLLGHTLSVIVIKSELASKLADRDTQRAIQEIRDVERISRKALNEVRHAIHGYRGESLAGELANGRAALEAAGVSLVADVVPIPLEADEERALALGLREAVTNVIRHARATTCTVTLQRNDGVVRLVVEDDGVGGAGGEGAGLAGMRTRLTAIGGSVRANRRTRHAVDTGRAAPPRPRRRRGGGDVIRVLIAEDQSMILGALAALLEIEQDIDVVGQARSGPEALELAARQRPDVVLTDIEMPGMTGLDLASRAEGDRQPRARHHPDDVRPSGYLRRALDVGASGYLLKDAPSAQLADAIRRVAAGGRAIDPALAAEAWSEPDPLTDRERQVLRLADEGRSSDAIARQLKLSEGTVRNYLSEAIGKLGAKNRVEAARLARQKGWL